MTLAQEHWNVTTPLLFFSETKSQGLQEPDNQILGGHAAVSTEGNHSAIHTSFLINAAHVFFSHFSYLLIYFEVPLCHYVSLFNKYVFVLQLIKFWEAFLPEAKAIA